MTSKLNQAMKKRKIEKAREEEKRMWAKETNKWGGGERRNQDNQEGP